MHHANAHHSRCSCRGRHVGRRLVFKSGGAGARQQHRPRATERDRSARGVRTCREVAPGARSRAGHSLASLDRAGGAVPALSVPRLPLPQQPPTGVVSGPLGWGAVSHRLLSEGSSPSSLLRGETRRWAWPSGGGNPAVPQFFVFVFCFFQKKIAGVVKFDGNNLKIGLYI